MPQRQDYQGLSLADAVRYLAEHHGEERTRHLSRDEYELLQRAADVIERTAPAMQAFSQ